MTAPPCARRPRRGRRQGVSSAPRSGSRHGPDGVESRARRSRPALTAERLVSTPNAHAQARRHPDRREGERLPAADSGATRSGKPRPRRPARRAMDGPPTGRNPRAWGLDAEHCVLTLGRRAGGAARRRHAFEPSDPKRIVTPGHRASLPRLAGAARDHPLPIPLHARGLSAPTPIGSSPRRSVLPPIERRRTRPLRAAPSGCTPTWGSSMPSSPPRLDRLAAALRDALRLIGSPGPRPRRRASAMPWRTNAWPLFLATVGAASTRAYFEGVSSTSPRALAAIHAHEYTASPARHPARARVRPLHRGEDSPGRCVASVLHSASHPFRRSAPCGRHHPHALGHPHSQGAARHRGLPGSACGARWPRCRVRLGVAHSLQVVSARRHCRRRVLEPREPSVDPPAHRPTSSHRPFPREWTCSSRRWPARGGPACSSR